MNRRTFLGAAVAATKLPGEALAAPAPSDRTIEAHETPEGVLYTVRDGERETRVIRRPGTYAYDLDNDAIHRAWAEDLSLSGKLVIRYLPPPLFEYTIVSRERGDERVVPHGGITGPVCGFRSPPSLQDVVAFHEACCADAPGRAINASVTPVGNFWSVADAERDTGLIWGRIDSVDLRTAGYPRTSTPSGMCSLSEVLAFHEQCIAADDGPLTVVRE